MLCLITTCQFICIPQGMIDSATDQLRHVDKEWTRRSHDLHRQLNLCRFRKESEQVDQLNLYMWPVKPVYAVCDLVWKT